MKKITEFFTALWITVRDDMKKEAQTYKEEREQQKRQEEGRKKRRVGLKHEQIIWKIF